MTKDEIDDASLLQQQQQQKKSHKQKSRKLIDSSEVWEDKESHQPQFLPSPDTQVQTTFSYDTTRFNFRELIISIFQCCCPDFEATDDSEETLSMIHARTETPICPNRTTYHSAMNNIKNAKTPQQQEVYTRYKALLLDFVRHVVAPLLNEEPDDLVFQRNPTLRVCLPSDQPMGVPHTDYEYHHMPSEVNIWIPLTRVYASNTLHTESRPGAQDFQPVELAYGEGLRFWGNKCRHYTVPNATTTTRVSLDFRVMARDRFNPHFRDMRGGRVGGQFRIGQYYLLSSSSDAAATGGVDDADDDGGVAGRCGKGSTEGGGGDDLHGPMRMEWLGMDDATPTN
jgi:hypothetical protein